jgi:signal transduction histidine kinase
VNSSAGLIVKYLELNNTDKIRKHIDRIKKSVRNLTAILNDFLSIEKLESGKISSASKICDIISIINEATEEVRDIAKDNQQFFYEGPEFIEMLSDPQLFKNVMLNLLTNAIKYSDEGGGIYVKVLDHKNKVIVSVRDEGIGIPEKDQKKMFDRFFRAGNVFNIEGTGLGLNIVKRYLDLLGGKISFSSREGVGTTFFVTLTKKK